MHASASTDKPRNKAYKTNNKAKEEANVSKDKPYNESKGQPYTSKQMCITAIVVNAYICNFKNRNA